jgi:hypothetical protein
MYQTGIAAVSPEYYRDINRNVLVLLVVSMFRVRCSSVVLVSLPSLRCVMSAELRNTLMAACRCYGF